jgi:pyrimidine operon attenuation protein/uracil phosphoribosyltransferase
MVEFTIQSLQFGSLFSYTPRPDLTNYPNAFDKMNNSKKYTIFLKQDTMVKVVDQKKSMPMSCYVAEMLSRKMKDLPFVEYFEGYTVLVPIPKSVPIPPGGLWVPERIAEAMVAKGIGNIVVPCLIRSKRVQKSSYSTPSERPTPEVHYDSLSVIKIVTELENVILIDDVITRGSTMLASANKLISAFPGIKIRAFGAIRTMSDANILQ